jgi:hypothetical protein
MPSTYSELELVANRTSVLLYGGSEEDRQAWADEASGHFPNEGPLRVVASEQGLEAALRDSRGVLFIPHGTALSPPAQLTLVRCLKEQEERPKIVLGIQGSQTQAMDKGLLRPDLDYTLSLSRVDLDAAAVRESIRARRGKSSRASKKPKAKPKPKTKRRH